MRFIPSSRHAPRVADREARSAFARHSMARHEDQAWQGCEPRLVLSAQLLTDVVDPLQLQLQLHSALPQQSQSAISMPVLGSTPLTGNELTGSAGSTIAIEPHTALAHQLTGWNQVQQEFGLKGSGQTVAVIDSGIAWDHVALGQGYGSGYRVVGGWDFAENDANPYDDGPAGFHGTHVAGIIGSNNAQYPGVASGVDLVGLRVFNDAGQGQIEWVEQALTWVHNNRNSFANPITTVNLSLGTTWNSATVPSWATLEDELRQLYNDGIVVTASAGNSFKQYNAPGLSYPAASSYVLPVASVDDSGNLSDFSQRQERVLAAPGRNITSSVPDHVLGRDGKINDFSAASGTSMAAPYVAGASVLVREAMQMVGLNDISPAKIIDWLHQSADTVYDSITKASYDRLNLQHAIDTLLPDDNISDDPASPAALSLSQKNVDGWINHLGDKDVYRFTANTSGRLTLDANSDWLDSLAWKITDNGTQLATGSLAPQSLQLQAGRSYELHLSAGGEIGPFQLALQFQADQNGGGSSNGEGSNSGGNSSAIGTTTSLGTVDYLSRDVAAGSAFRATASHDGLFTIQWHNPDSASGSLVARDANGRIFSDSTWEDGMLRLDLTASAGQTFDFQLPGTKSDTGTMTLADVVQLRGNELRVYDTSGNDNIQLDLSRSVALSVGKVEYDFATSAVARISIDGTAGADTLSVVGSALSDKVDMRPDLFTLSNSQLTVSANNFEQVRFDSGGGVLDRLYMYDSDGDDTLIARPGSAELTGAGYQFNVVGVERIFIHATGFGTDLASLYDSAGNDQLTMRPQFTSLQGDGFFLSIRGFERVYAYANAGGLDTADLYDSAGDDRFFTSGEAASLVGPGFNSFTRFFEKVHAHADAGGKDLATLYGSSTQTAWLRGSDFVSFNEAAWNRNAQGFENTSAFVNGLAQSIPDVTQNARSASLTRLSVDEDGAFSDNSFSDNSFTNLSSEPQAPRSDDANGSPVPASVNSLPADWITARTMARANEFEGSSYLQLNSIVSELHTHEMQVDGVSDLDLAIDLLNQTSELRSLVDSLRVDEMRTDEMRAEASVDELAFHTDPSAERALLDAIFSEL